MAMRGMLVESKLLATTSFYPHSSFACGVLFCVFIANIQECHLLLIHLLSLIVFFQQLIVMRF